MLTLSSLDRSKFIRIVRTNSLSCTRFEAYQETIGNHQTCVPQSVQFRARTINMQKTWMILYYSFVVRKSMYARKVQIWARMEWRLVRLLALIEQVMAVKMPQSHLRSEELESVKLSIFICLLSSLPELKTTIRLHSLLSKPSKIFLISHQKPKYALPAAPPEPPFIISLIMGPRGELSTSCGSFKILSSRFLPTRNSITTSVKWLQLFSNKS